MKLKNQEEITEGDFNTAKVLNIFFSKISSNLNIMEYSKCELLANNISDPVLKWVVKYRNHYSILAIGEVCNKYARLPFFFEDKQRRNSAVNLKLEICKAYEDNDIPKKITYIFANGFLSSFHDSVEKPNFPSSLKIVNTTPVARITTDLLAFFQVCLKYLSDVFFVSSAILYLDCFQNISMVFRTQCRLLAMLENCPTLRKNEVFH